MADGLLDDTEYDLIAIGTGLVQSIVSAAAGKINRKVLHVDQNEYYASNWATFSFGELKQWMLRDEAGTLNPTSTIPAPQASQTEAGAAGSSQADDVKSPPDTSVDISKGSGDRCFVPEAMFACDEQVPAAVTAVCTLANLIKLRLYSLDLVPQLIYQRGALVDSLVRSGVGK